MNRPKQAPSTEHPEGYRWEIRVTNMDFFRQQYTLLPKTVYAWDLRSALRKAADIPISEYFEKEEPW